LNDAGYNYSTDDYYDYTYACSDIEHLLDVDILIGGYWIEMSVE